MRAHSPDSWGKQECISNARSAIHEKSVRCDRDRGSVRVLQSQESVVKSMVWLGAVVEVLKRS